MNISKFTQKSIDAVQKLEKTAYDFGNQEIEQEHLLYILLNQEDSLILKLIEKMGIQKEMFRDEIENALNSSVSVPKLSNRQLEVLGLVAKGFSNHDVARILGISVNSVKDHLKNIYSILNVSSRTEASSLAINLNLVTG